MSAFFVRKIKSRSERTGIQSGKYRQRLTPRFRLWPNLALELTITVPVTKPDQRDVRRLVRKLKPVVKHQVRQECAEGFSLFRARQEREGTAARVRLCEHETENDRN